MFLVRVVCWGVVFEYGWSKHHCFTQGLGLVQSLAAFTATAGFLVGGACSFSVLLAVGVHLE